MFYSYIEEPKKPSRWDVSDKEKKKKDTISEFISLARSKTDIQAEQSRPAEAKNKQQATEAVSKMVRRL